MSTAVSQPGDLWILGDHRLLCGDSMWAEDVKRLMAGERAVLFATDPPYLVDYDGTNHPPNRQSANPNKDWSPSYGATWDDSSQGPELYDGFIKAAIDDAITEDAAWYCWHASRRQAMVESCWEKAGAFVHQQIIWVKDRSILTRSHYLWKHEPCFYGWVIRLRRPQDDHRAARPSHPSLRDHRDRQRELALQEPLLSRRRPCPRPGCPGGSTGTPRAASLRVAQGATRSRAGPPY